MARDCGMGASLFCRLCRALFNQSPVQRLNRIRLDWAAEALRAEPDRSITGIALASGYGSSQYFATAFRRHTGLTPGAWRQRR